MLVGSMSRMVGEVAAVRTTKCVFCEDAVTTGLYEKQSLEVFIYASFD